MFGYLRKTRKASGTRQQLEGPAAGPLERRALASGALDALGAASGEGSRSGGGAQREAAAAAVAAAARDDGGPLEAIWVDDVLSTGGSLAAGVAMMREVYGVRVVGAVYLIDRSADRRAKAAGSGSDSDSGAEQQAEREALLRGLDIVALYDLQQVEVRVRTLRRAELEAVVARL